MQPDQPFHEDISNNTCIDPAKVDPTKYNEAAEIGVSQIKEMVK